MVLYRILKVNYNCLLLLDYHFRKKKINQFTLPKNKLIIPLLFVPCSLYDYLCFLLTAGKICPKLTSYEFLIHQTNTYLDWVKATQQTDDQPDVSSCYGYLVLCYSE